jgi:hypothetical protein
MSARVRFFKEAAKKYGTVYSDLGSFLVTGKFSVKGKPASPEAWWKNTWEENRQTYFFIVGSSIALLTGVALYSTAKSAKKHDVALSFEHVCTSFLDGGFWGAVVGVLHPVLIPLFAPPTLVYLAVGVPQMIRERKEWIQYGQDMDQVTNHYRCGDVYGAKFQYDMSFKGWKKRGQQFHKND